MWIGYPWETTTGAKTEGAPAGSEGRKIPYGR